MKDTSPGASYLARAFGARRAGVASSLSQVGSSALHRGIISNFPTCRITLTEYPSMASVHPSARASNFAPPPPSSRSAGGSVSTTSKRVTPPGKRGRRGNGGHDDPASRIEKAVVDELLLVCGVIASRDEATGRIVPVTDCLKWLQDLQRALRRDDDSHRPISLLLGGWRVVQQKLLPLILACRYDPPLVLTIVKILVILTKPVSDQAKRAGRLVIDVASKKVPEE